jgi:hypothetical protein
VTTMANDQQQALRRAAMRATLAPSVHNTQPWRFVLRPGQLELYADWSRQLSVLDPTGRQLTISCGCALFNARVALAALGGVDVSRFPDSARPQLLARVGSGGGGRTSIGMLDPLIELRQSNRRRFEADEVPEDVVELLLDGASAEGARLFPVRDTDHRLAVATLSQHADREENANPAYRAELRRWTTDDRDRRDGVPALAVPRVDGSAEDDVPIRDFDTHGSGLLPAETNSSLQQCLLLLGTDEDNAEGWLRAGEALERVLLEVTRLGYVASVLTQVVEVPWTREQVRSQLGLSMQPHVLLRVGRAPAGPASPRRQMVDVLVEEP